MESVTQFRRSDSLDLPKESLFSFGIDRNRNDSGCFEDFEPNGQGAGFEDPVVSYWDEAITQWSERAKSVIAQEVNRMKELTKKRKRDLLKQQNRDKVHQVWKHNMRETMDLAHDLMKCVSYDILEEFGFEPTPVVNYQKSSGLDKITEEDLEETLEKRNKVLIIKVDHRIRRMKPTKRRPLAKSPFAKSVPRSKSQKSTLTLLLDELKELRRMCGGKRDHKKEPWGCKQCLTNPNAWQDEDKDCFPCEQVEDIFRDWIRMLKKFDTDFGCSDINEVFWKLSCDQTQVRTRRMSEVVDEMHFGDRPDIFRDRCEILESNQVSAKRRKRSLTSYWNIFNDWKKNLDVAPTKMTEWKRIEMRKNAQNAKVQATKFHPEEIFEEWRHHFEDFTAGPRRRSLEEDDCNDIIILASPVKKIKRDYQERKKGSEMAYKFGRAYQTMKRNFMIALGTFKCVENEDFDFWSNDRTIEDLVKSRNDFCKLRFEMRQQREQNRRINEIVMPESWMNDWSWNLEELEPSTKLYSPPSLKSLTKLHLLKSTREFVELRLKVQSCRMESRQINGKVFPEAWMAEWKWNLDGPVDYKMQYPTRRQSDVYGFATAEDFFRDWRRTVLRSVGGENSDSDIFNHWIKSAKKRPNKSRRMKMILAPSVGQPRQLATSKPGFKNVVSPQQNSAGTSAKDSFSCSKQATERASRKLMVKCQAKQPSTRGWN